MQMTPLEIISGAKEFLRRPAMWCKGSCYKLDPETHLPIARDLMTALMDAARMPDAYALGSDAWDVALKAVWNETAGMGISRYNDSSETTHAHVFALLERAEEKVRL